jgi:serine/threonine-protein kinase
MLQYIHSQQVIHRDIKPANLIRRSQDKKLVLIDFGAVKDQVTPIRVDATEQTALTAYAIGTPGYAPPEQMAMRPVYASDIYALGVTCIYLLTGRSPKDLDYDPATGEMVWQVQVQVSEHFASVLKKMLEVSVRHRYQNAGEVLRALDLEPYLDSLAQGMVVKPNRFHQSDSLPNSIPQSINSSDLEEPSSPSSPSARMAAAIRARNAARAAGIDSTSLQSSGLSRRSPSQRPLTVHSGRIKEHGNGEVAADELLIAYAKGKRDFSYHDLSMLILTKSNLSGANFHQSKLHKTNLQGSNLFSVDFGRASLSQATLRNANLARAYLSHADLQGADLRGADLSYAYLSNANLRGANLCGADLTGAKVGDEQLAMARTNWATVHPSGKRGMW